MMRKGKSNGHGYAFGFPKRIESGLAALRKENVRRVKCEHCELMILPENMDRHIRISHSD
jgi:hypothetical protein